MGGRASRTGDKYAGRTVTGTGSTCYRSRVNHTPDRTPTTGADVDGRSARWEGHRQARRAELVTAAITAIEERGAGAGMDEIASVAGTSKTVFYRHFHDRAGLYRAVAERVDRIVLGKLRRTLSGSDADAAEALGAGESLHRRRFGPAVAALHRLDRWFDRTPRAVASA